MNEGAYVASLPHTSDQLVALGLLPSEREVASIVSGSPNKRYDFTSSPFFLLTDAQKDPCLIPLIWILLPLQMTIQDTIS